MRIQAIGAELAIQQFDKGVVGRFAEPGECTERDASSEVSLRRAIFTFH